MSETVRSTAPSPVVSPATSALNRTPRANRLHVAVCGRRNAGKSSLINAIAGQDVALVSPVAGTTTDPVYKAMEIHGLGPVVLIDTAGTDDEGELGKARVARSERVLRQTDVALLAIDGVVGPGDAERDLATALRRARRPFLVVATKADQPDAVWTIPARLATLPATLAGQEMTDADVSATVAASAALAVSAVTGQGIPEVIAALAAIGGRALAEANPPLLEDLLAPGEVCVLVTPIDAEAPAGRMILPQMQALRAVLDARAIAVFAQPEELAATLAGLTAPPALVITDSQVFGIVSALVPSTVPLTSFSMLMARQKGDLDVLTAGARAVADLRPGDAVLIAEGCTHHAVADDIGRVKIPAWLTKRVGGPLHFTWVAGADFPADLSGYRLVVHCGACMLNRREVLARLTDATAAGVPVVNYGVLIAHLHGILERAAAPLARVAEPADQRPDETAAGGE